MVLLFSRREDGHRRSYLDFFMRLFEGRRVSARELWLSREPMLFMMIEEDFALFAAAAVFRAVLGRRTVGLVFRPLPALRGTGVRLLAKRVVLGWLKQLPTVTTLTILPFSVEPEFARIASGWIYDPQLWDLSEADRLTGTTALSDGSYLAPVMRLSGGRRLVAAIGRMDRAKGFDSFARAYVQSPELRRTTLFLSCGSVHEEVADHGMALVAAGAAVIDRQVTDLELLQAYAAADIVWCCYAADYDQASGVLGRAVQLGVPVIVRTGSLIERFCELEGVAHLGIDPAQFDSLPAIAARDPDRGAALAAKMARHSLPVLAKALGVVETDA